MLERSPDRTLANSAFGFRLKRKMRFEFAGSSPAAEGKLGPLTVDSIASTEVNRNSAE